MSVSFVRNFANQFAPTFRHFSTTTKYIHFPPAATVSKALLDQSQCPEITDLFHLVGDMVGGKVIDEAHLPDVTRSIMVMYRTNQFSTAVLQFLPKKGAGASMGFTYSAKQMSGPQFECALKFLQGQLTSIPSTKFTVLPLT